MSGGEQYQPQVFGLYAAHIFVSAPIALKIGQELLFIHLFDIIVAAMMILIFHGTSGTSRVKTLFENPAFSTIKNENSKMEDQEFRIFKFRLVCLKVLANVVLLSYHALESVHGA